MTLRIAVLILTTLSLGLADTLTLNTGQVIEGTYLGGDARSIRMAVGDKIESYGIGEISTLRFGAAKPPAQRSEQAAPAAATGNWAVEIPAGSELVVRMIDSVDSEVNRVGQTFKASVDEPVVVDGKTVVPRGADVVAKLVEDEQSGKLTGRTALTMALVSLTVNGRMVDTVTQEVTTASDSRGQRTAKVVGGTAALGAIIGAIAGGGKGAAVGAASGAGAGTAIQVMTKGQQVKIPSETRLAFTLKQPVRL